MPLINPLTGEDFGIPLIGIVDLVLEGEDGLTVVDFKTAANSSYCPLQNELQLTAYACLLGRENVSELQIRQIVKTKTPKIVTHRFSRSDEHFERFFGVVREFLDALQKNVFNFRPGFGCQMCEHSQSCASFSVPSSNYKEPQQWNIHQFAIGN